MTEEKAIKEFIKNLTKNRLLVGKIKTFREFYKEKHPECSDMLFISGETQERNLIRMFQATADYQDYLREFYYG